MQRCDVVDGDVLRRVAAALHAPMLEHQVARDVE